MVSHPAKFSDALIPLFARILREHGARRVLDPMAGVGKLALVRQHGFSGLVVCNELEPEWASQAHGLADIVTVADAAHLPYPTAFFDVIVTSPTYGNRMADHHNARDGSRRVTYRHCLGRPLTPGNTGMMQWGEVYRRAHLRIWRECLRVLRPGGILVINVSNHIRNWEEQHVAEWHRDALRGMGMTLLAEHRVLTPRMRFGENWESRVPCESVFVLQKGDDA